MWNLYATAKTAAVRASDLVCIADRWTAYQFDTAVSVIGTALENASQEMQEVGGLDGKKSFQPKYTMDMLLEPDFRLPRPKTAEDRERDAIGMLRALAGRKGSGVKVFRAKSTEET